MHTYFTGSDGCAISLVVGVAIIGVVMIATAIAAVVAISHDALWGRSCAFSWQVNGALLHHIPSSWHDSCDAALGSAPVDIVPSWAGETSAVVRYLKKEEGYHSGSNWRHRAIEERIEHI